MSVAQVAVGFRFPPPAFPAGATFTPVPKYKAFAGTITEF